MPKTAYLVDFSLRRRIIVDMPETATADEKLEVVIAAIANTEHELCLSFEGDLGENLENFKEDTEIPYGAMPKDSFK